MPFETRERVAAFLVPFVELHRVDTVITACRDPKDNKFLEAAIAARADVIVTGDADLLALHPFRGIPILSPAAFLESEAAK